MNADGGKTEHPRNIRLAIEDQYSGPSVSKAADRVMSALDLLQREGYLIRSYRDVADHDWLTLTDKGKAITKAGMIQEARAALSSQQPIVFISCGQYTDEERAVGSGITVLIQKYTNYVPYFAEEQH
ncbi:MAG TPA: hypothetical protein VIW73_08775, partial [Candidatus Cybelea sp.]